MTSMACRNLSVNPVYIQVSSSSLLLKKEDWYTDIVLQRSRFETIRDDQRIVPKVCGKGHGIEF